ncbi:MAG: Endolytic murein transglycosylase [Holosporales bacterium]
MTAQILGSMPRRLLGVFYKLIFLLLALGGIVGMVFYGPLGVFHTQNVGANRFVVVPSGAGLKDIAYLMERENITSSSGFILATFLSQNRGKLKAGEYAVPVRVSAWDMAKLLASGKTVIRKLTVVEGTSVRQVIKALQENPILKGEITRIPKEGFILPETYLYFYGDDRQSILDKMEKNMHQFLLSLGNIERPLIKNMNDLVTLASLVEKETAMGAERPLVAGVYLNRLRINMPLQCDPTVIYALMHGEKLDRPLSKADLQVSSPYNTYKVKGLPPGPIACPGKAAILAVLNPARTQSLYFVANGQGGHAFADNLNDHNVNIRQWRAIQQGLRQEQVPLPVVNPESVPDVAAQKVVKTVHKRSMVKQKHPVAKKRRSKYPHRDSQH